MLAEMRLRARSLALHGHEVEWLDPWREPSWERYDLAHLFMANGESVGLGQRMHARLPLVVSPIVDRCAPDAWLRASTWLERRLPGFWSHLGRARALCELADGVCARSREEERRVVRGLGVRVPTRVLLCPVDAASAAPRVRAPASAELARLAGRPFLFFLGDAGNPRKNVLGLLDAVRPLDLDLAVGGAISATPYGRRVRRRLERGRRLHPVGFLTDADRRWAFERAAAVVLPSRMEGIGLAAVEAGLAGATVVVSRRGGAPDYFGERAHYVEGGSVASIRAGIRAALGDPRDAARVLRERLDPRRCGAELASWYAELATRGKRLAA